MYIMYVDTYIWGGRAGYNFSTPSFPCTLKRAFKKIFKRKKMRDLTVIATPWYLD